MSRRARCWTFFFIVRLLFVSFSWIFISLKCTKLLFKGKLILICPTFLFVTYGEASSFHVEVNMDYYFLFTCMCQCPHVGKFFGFLCISEGSPTCTMTAIPISAWKFMWQWKSQKPVKFIIVWANTVWAMDIYPLHFTFLRKSRKPVANCW